MEELILEKLDNTTLKVRYENYTAFTRERLEYIKKQAEETLTKVNLMLTELNK